MAHMEGSGTPITPIEQPGPIGISSTTPALFEAGVGKPSTTPLNRRGGNHPFTTIRPGATEHGRKLGLTASSLGWGGSTPNKRGGSPFCAQNRQRSLSLRRS